MTLTLTTKRLTKRYGDAPVVEELSLQVREGEIYAFLGLNGAGKTTTIRMLLNMIRPTSGTATILGMPVSGRVQPLWSQVGYLVETPSAYPELTVRENLDVARRLRQIDNPGVVDRIMDRLGLTPYAARPASKLSLGNAQRLGLAKALLHNPRLLILDEPANGLDPAGVVEVRSLLQELARDHGVTVFMSSHILGEVARLAHRIGIIHHGRLLEELDAETLHRRQRQWLEVSARDPHAAATTLRQSGFRVQPASGGMLRLDSEEAVTNPDKIAQLLVAAGSSPTRLCVEQEDLEAHFLRMTRIPRGGQP